MLETQKFSSIVFLPIIYRILTILDLYRQDSGKYRMLKPPDIANLFNENLMPASLLKDFSDIHETTVQYGSPELADQLSGAMYMHAQSVEDKSSIGKEF